MEYDNDMSNEKLAAELHEKAAAEQEIYRNKLYAMPSKEALEHAFEYVTRENILMALESPEMEDVQIRALLASSTPLKDIFHHYDNLDFTLMEGIRKSIAELADDTLTQWRDLPVYKYPADYARENGEWEQYKASHDANISCMKAIHRAISGHQELYSFDNKAAVKEVVEQFGYDRTLYVLAATLRSKEHDGRFSYANKKWARSIPVFEDINKWGDDRNRDFVVQSHPTLTDAFLETARHEYLLSLPLTKEDIKAEALNILSKFQNAREPNSPNGTHYMAQISPDFLARANTKDTDRLMSMLPFHSLSFSTLEGYKGKYALILKDENRFQKLVLRRPSVRKKLQEQTDTPKCRAPGKKKEQER